MLLLASYAGAEPRVAGNITLSENPYGLSSPQAMAMDSVRHELWVAGHYSDNLVVVDALTHKPLASLPNLRPTALAADSSRAKVYAAASGFLYVYDSATRAQSAKLALTNFYPKAMDLDAPSGELYMLGTQWQPANSQWSSRLARLDPKTGAVLAALDMPSDHMTSGLAVGESRVYLAIHVYNMATTSYKAELWVLDKTLLTVIQKLSLNTYYPTMAMVDPRNQTVFLGDFGRLLALKVNTAGSLVIVSTLTGVGSNWDMALDTSTNRIYGLDRYSNKVNLIDVGAWKLVKSLPAGSEPSSVAFDQGLGQAFVANFNSNDVSVYNLKTDSALDLIDLRRYLPKSLALEQSTGRIVAACGLTNAIAFWNRNTQTMERTVSENYQVPTGLALFPGLKKSFILSGQDYSGTIKKIHLDGLHTDSLSFNLSGVSSLNAFPEGNMALVTQLYTPTPPYGNGALTLVDASAEIIIKTIPLGGLTNESPRDAAANPQTGKAYVVLYATRQVQVVNLSTGELIKKITVGYFPYAAAVNPNLNRVYVANYGSNSLSVIDGNTDSVIATVPVGKGPKAVAIKKKGGRVYVANTDDGTVTVLDGLSLHVVAVLPSGGFPEDLQVDEEAHAIYAANTSSSSITVFEDVTAADIAPAVSHTPSNGPYPEDKPLTIEAHVSDDQAVAAVTLTYWEPGKGAYYTVPMISAGDSLYKGTIPAEFLLSLNGGQVSYFIDAADALGNGPPTGLTPGTAEAPNSFTVRKNLVTRWSRAFGKVYGNFYRMIPGPSAAIGDIRKDVPGLEVATGNEEYFPLGTSVYPSPSGRWFLFTSTGGTSFWKDTQNDEAHSSVNLFDLDGDGNLEMLGGTTSGNQLQAWDRFANWVWRVILGSHHISTPAAEILTPGSSPRVFGGSFDAKFRSVDGKTGAVRWQFPAGTWIWSSPAIADLDGDGLKEVVFGTDQTAAGTANFYVLDADTGTVRWKAALGGNVRASAALPDLNGDGIIEVLIGAPDGIFRAFHGKTGALLWSFKTGGEIVSSAACGDLDGDGILEIVFGSADGKLYALNRDGTLRWAVALGSPVLGSPALANRGVGKGLDVYVTAAGGVLYLVRGHDGVKLAGFGVGAAVVSSPVVGDTDGDGKLDIFFQDRRGDTNSAMIGDMFWAVTDQTSQVSPFAKEWPMFRRDSQHTGVYPAAPPSASTPPPDNQAPLSKILSPAHGTVLSTTGVTLSGTAFDADSGVAFVELSLRDLTNTAQNWLVVQGTAAFSHVFSGLEDNHSYQAVSRATDKEGNQEIPSSIIEFSVKLPQPAPPPQPAPAPTPAPPPQNGTCSASARLKIPKEGKTLWGNAVTLMAETTCAGAPVTKVLFQQRRHGATTWVDISSADSKHPYSVYWNISDANTDPGKYDLRAVAYDSNGVADAAPPQIWVAVDDANADIVEDGNPEVDPNKPHRLSSKIESNTGDTVNMADGTSVVVPPGALPAADTLVIDTLTPAQAPPPSSRKALLKSANVFRELKFKSGHKSFAKSITVSLPIPDQDHDGKVDGNGSPVASLKPYYHDDKGEWLPVTAPAGGLGSPLASVQEVLAGSAVNFQTDHFTTFGLFEEIPKNQDLGFGDVYAFPNPARAGKNPTFHIEAGGADSVLLTVYNSAGALVFESEINGPPLSVDDGQGLESAFEKLWDVSGVPSGVYRFIVKARLPGAGSITRIGKCSIIK